MVGDGRRSHLLLLALSGVVAIAISVGLNLDWWQSGLLTGTLMVAIDIGYNRWPVRFPKQRSAKFRRNDRSPSFMGFVILPLVGYGMAVGWLLTHSPSMVTVFTSLVIGALATGHIIATVETGKSLPRLLIRKS